jgi:hypothetical protein
MKSLLLKKIKAAVEPRRQGNQSLEKGNKATIRALLIALVNSR